MAEEISGGSGRARLWENRAIIALTVVAMLAATILIQGTGAMIAFVIALVVALIARKSDSFRDMGFRRPDSWPKLLGTTLAYGLVLQALFLVIIEPQLARWTGVPVDVSVFDWVRGSLQGLLILLAIGWAVGGFIEEFAFRGFVVSRLRWLLGSGTAATWAAVFVAALAFGLAHAYQGASGMISTGLTGFALGAVYVLHSYNLWYAIFTHGFTNTAGIIAIYLDIDSRLGSLLFG